MPPVSPVLLNSCFSEMDYFSQYSNIIGRSPPSPASSSSSFSASPTLRQMQGKTMPPVEEDYDRVFESYPELSAKEAARMSVHVGESLKTVNWARPIRELETVRLFGSSIQRTRRLRRLQSSLPSPPSSSDDEPLTPSPVLPSSGMDIPSQGWSVEATGKGLGVFGIEEWDTSMLSYLSEEKESLMKISKSLTVDIELASPKAREANLSSTTLPTPRRVLATAESMNNFVSPTTLDELKALRQAAFDLENEARRPMKPAVVRERRIKRKAVPALSSSDIEFVEEPIVYISATPERLIPRKAVPSYRLPTKPRPKTVYDMPDSIEISPRLGSLPFSIPPRHASHMDSSFQGSSVGSSNDFELSGSRLSDYDNGSDWSNSSVSDQLLSTPTGGLTPKDEKLSLDVEEDMERLGLSEEFAKRLEFDLAGIKGKKDLKTGVSRLLKRSVI